MMLFRYALVVNSFLTSVQKTTEDQEQAEGNRVSLIIEVYCCQRECAMG